MIKRNSVIAVVAVFSAPMPLALGQWGPVKVLTQTVELRRLPSTATLVGTLEPIRRSTLGSAMAGSVLDMPVRQGDRVEKGQLLCKLDDATAQAQLAEARGKLASLQAQLSELEAGSRPEELARLKALYENEKAKHDRWVQERKRIKNLYGDAESNEKEVYETETSFQAAEQMMLAAKAAYEAAVAGPRREVIEGARQAVAEQSAVVRRHEIDIARMEIGAPFSGYVVRLHTEVGEWIMQGGPVVELIDLSSVLVRVDLPERAMAYCRTGDRATVAVDALDRVFEGTVRHVMRQADPVARSFPVEIEVANESSGFRVQGSVSEEATGRARTQESADSADYLLAAGMFARVTLAAGPDDEFPSVPKDAIVRREGVDYVCMVQKNEGAEGQGGGVAKPAGPEASEHSGPQEKPPTMAIPVPVTTGADAGDWVAIISGNIAPGMEVVIAGNEGIRFPSPVMVVDPSELAMQKNPKVPVPQS